MSELAYQAANGSYSRGQRRTLEAEFLALDKEIRRISNTTRFNGIDLLGGRQSARASTTIDLGGDDTAFGGPSGASLDGRYITSLDGATGNLILIDTVTGVQTTIADGGAYNDITRAKSLQNGDVAFADASIGEVFYWTKETGQIRSLTENDTGSSFISDFTISDDGTTIAFVSGANFVNGGSLNDRGAAHPGYQLWAMNLQEGTLRIIQNSQSAVALGTSIQLSQDGSFLIASDTSLQRVWIANTSGPTTLVRELTTTASVLLGVTNSGVAFFRSTANPTGENPGAFSQIFSLTHASGTFDQLTNMTSSGLFGGRLSGDGSTIYIFSTLDLAGDGNTGGVRQLFSFDTHNPGFRRLTNLSSSIGLGAFVSGDGGRVFSQIGGNIMVLDTTLEGVTVDFELGYGSRGNISDTINALARSVRGLGTFGLSSELASRAAMDRIKQNSEQLNTSRGLLGALMSRLSSATNIISSLRDEFIAAAGRIRDADVAIETSNLTKQQILQRIGASVLAQANTSPQLALQLLSN